MWPQIILLKRRITLQKDWKLDIMLKSVCLQSSFYIITQTFISFHRKHWGWGSWFLPSYWIHNGGRCQYRVFQCHKHYHLLSLEYSLLCGLIFYMDTFIDTWLTFTICMIAWSITWMKCFCHGAKLTPFSPQKIMGIILYTLLSNDEAMVLGLFL